MHTDSASIALPTLIHGPRQCRPSTAHHLGPPLIDGSGREADRLKAECRISQSTMSRLIRKLASKNMIYQLGYEWRPSSELSQLSQVKQNHVVVIHSLENEDASKEVNTTVESRTPEGPAALAALSGAASATAGVNGEPSMIEVMQFILTYVANLRSKHNQQEGMKKSRDKNYQFKKFTPREKIEAMRDLVLSLSGAVAQNTLQRDLSWISKSMDLLIPDWNNPKCLDWARNKMREAREANMVAGIPAPVEPAPEPVVDPYAWLNEPSTEPPYDPVVDEDSVFTRPIIMEPTGPDCLDVPAILAQHAADLQATRDAEHAAVIARIDREMAQDAAQAVEVDTELVGRIRAVLQPGVTLPTGKLAPMVGAGPHEVYDALRDMGAEVKNYTHAGVSLWEREAVWLN